MRDRRPHDQLSDDHVQTVGRAVARAKRLAVPRPTSLGRDVPRHGRVDCRQTAALLNETLKGCLLLLVQNVA